MVFTRPATFVGLGLVAAFAGGDLALAVRHLLVSFAAASAAAAATTTPTASASAASTAPPAVAARAAEPAPPPAPAPAPAPVASPATTDDKPPGGTGTPAGQSWADLVEEEMEELERIGSLSSSGTPSPLTDGSVSPGSDSEEGGEKEEEKEERDKVLLRSIFQKEWAPADGVCWADLSDDEDEDDDEATTKAPASPSAEPISFTPEEDEMDWSGPTRQPPRFLFNVRSTPQCIEAPRMWDGEVWRWMEPLLEVEEEE